ncbi:MAG: YaaA family protein, partial [Bacteroidales bacterium]|nr:YaaA family protein [Bacteroidales bacterium]
MLILISPAKTLDFKTKPLVQSTDEPVFVNEANYLVSLLQQYHLNELGHLLSLSKTLAQLNFERYHNWKNITTEIKKPAIFAYKGDVYQGLNADEWDLPTLEFAQKHLRIISGLYGYLRPLDLIKPYRLDMGTPLKSETSADLYDFWRGRITGQVIDDMALMNSDLIVNLASFEY